MTEEVEKVTVYRERLVNFGDFQQEKISMGIPAVATEPGLRAAAQLLMNILNQEEIDARRNHKNQEQLWRDEEKEMDRQTQLEEEAKWRQLKGIILSHLVSDPDQTPDDLAEKFELRHHRILNALDELVEEGKLERRECKRLFNVIP